MWFRQFQIFTYTENIQSSATTFAKKLQDFEFTPCAPSMSTSIGFVSPIEEDDEPLARGINQCIMFCLQIEEKILPSNVIYDALKLRVKEIEAQEGRKVRQKEKLALKDEIIFTLLPRAFSRFSKVYAYLDTKNQWLVINNINTRKVEFMLNMLQKAFGEIFAPLDIVQPAPILTHWVKRKDYPAVFGIERACVLQDPQQQNRIIRCHQQDLFAGGIQSLLTDGCEITQVALCWQDKINFILDHHFTFRSVRLVDEDTALQDGMQTEQQKFNSDFMVMSELFTALFRDLFAIFVRNQKETFNTAA